MTAVAVWLLVSIGGSAASAGGFVGVAQTSVYEKQEECATNASDIIMSGGIASCEEVPLALVPYAMLPKKIRDQMPIVDGTNPNRPKGF